MHRGPVFLERLDCFGTRKFPVVQVPIQGPREFHPALFSDHGQGVVETLFVLGLNTDPQPTETHFGIV